MGCVWFNIEEMELRYCYWWERGNVKTRNTFIRVCTLFSTKNSRTFQGLTRTQLSIFQGLQEGQNQANEMPHRMLTVESASIFRLRHLRSFVG